jgi:hypothetical protein
MWVWKNVTCPLSFFMSRNVLEQLAKQYEASIRTGDFQMRTSRRESLISLHNPQGWVTGCVRERVE